MEANSVFPQIFAQDLSQRLDQTHPGIAGVIGSSNKARIILLCAEDLVFCNRNLVDIDDIRRPWQERRIGPPIPVETTNGGRAVSVESSVSLATPNEQSFTAPGILAVKESDVLLKQLASVVRFLERMEVEVSWWQFKLSLVHAKFKPSWVGLRGNQQLVLVDWAQETKPELEGEFEPRYAVHVIGLGFSDILPESFQDSGRLLAGLSRYFMHIHNMNEQRIINMFEATFPQGPRHQEVWTTSIAITFSFNGRGLGVYTVSASTKRSARDTASFHALIALGIDVNSLPN
ncbi:hypothetical protein M407DRAFT_33364 [Tulasnella calospora MUT 4182]|uniref:Uncharacterized protein n=1 Tax=Tulasnella calospora MUT 4182 TaxID=1051891 RepID=A0A0C3PQV3_9AGAM|nr:hypothetical protein M407DRAFT_33364 [Tulasnella calospora MUT 4182]